MTVWQVKLGTRWFVVGIDTVIADAEDAWKLMLLPPE